MATAFVWVTGPEGANGRCGHSNNKSFAYIPDKKHTIWLILWICNVVLCNICAGIKNLKPRFTFLERIILVFWLDEPKRGDALSWASLAQTHRNSTAIKNYNRLFMIRIIQSYNFMNMWCHFIQCVSNYTNSEARLYCFQRGYFGIWQHWVRCDGADLSASPRRLFWEIS